MSELRLHTLLAVRPRSRGDAEAVRATVADLMGRADVDIGGELGDATTLDYVRTRGEGGRRSLTPAGETELAALLADDTERAGRTGLADAYSAFLPLNHRFLSACVRWQNRAEPTPALNELADVVDLIGPVLDRLTGYRSRFACYRPRLAVALQRAETDPRWVDSPADDSVHTIWFELHEHLLATLGRNRTDEP